ncbi:MAG: hypothetical protein H0V43_05995 [Gemmatimonadales bacterium]|nr:hypothetical protein [Gemmatimonadales bacterium]
MIQRYRALRSASTRSAALALALLGGAATVSAQQPDVEAAVHGLILMNAFHTSARVNNSDVPQFALPADPAENPATAASGGTVRQSRVTATALVPELLGGALTASWTWTSTAASSRPPAGAPFPCSGSAAPLPS